MESKKELLYKIKELEQELESRWHIYQKDIKAITEEYNELKDKCDYLESIKPMEAKTKETNEFKILQEKEDRLNEAIQMYNEGLPSPRALSERVRELEAALNEINGMCADVGNTPEGKLNSGKVAQISIRVLSKVSKEQP